MGPQMGPKMGHYRAVNVLLSRVDILLMYCCSVDGFGPCFGPGFGPGNGPEMGRNPTPCLEVLPYRDRGYGLQKHARKWPHLGVILGPI
jgi:hypothetical protein